MKVTLCYFPKFPLLIPAILVVLVIRLIRPWLLVRWSTLQSSRIGHFSLNTEVYYCEREAGINLPSQRYVDCFFMDQVIANKQLANMWKRVLHIWPNWTRSPIYLANWLNPGKANHILPDRIEGDRDIHNLVDHCPPHLNFNSKETDRGEAGLHMMGIPTGVPFVCLMVRDSAYLDTHSPNQDWSYHNYRDSDIQNYVLAAEELANRGYFVIRMGAVVRESMKSCHPRIIDYATNGMRSDFMDIYLSAKCEFCISGVAGFDAVPFIFRRPIVWVNFVPLGYLPASGAQFMGITKHYYSLHKGRNLTFKEIFANGTGFYLRTSDYESKGVQMIENTPEEIRDVVVEMAERLKNTWQAQEDDEALQRKFWDIFPSNARSSDGSLLHGKILSRFGAAFLRENSELLE